MIYPLSSLPLSARNRVSQITFHSNQPYLAVQSHDRSVEIFRIRTEEEVRKKQLRRKKREKEKGKAKGKGDNDKKGKAISKENSASNANGADAAEEDEMNEDPVKEIGLGDLFTPYLVVRASGKVRSFSFVDEEPSPKGDIQVREIALSPNVAKSSNFLTINSCSCSLPSHQMHWKYLECLHLNPRNWTRPRQRQPDSSQ